MASFQEAKMARGHGGRRPGSGRKAKKAGATSPPGSKVANFSTRITPDIRAQLDAIAASTGRSVSQIVGELLQSGLKAHADREIDEPIHALAYLLRLLANQCSYVNTEVSDDDR